jgi:hypothetical protein
MVSGMTFLLSTRRRVASRDQTVTPLKSRRNLALIGFLHRELAIFNSLLSFTEVKESVTDSQKAGNFRQLMF